MLKPPTLKNLIADATQIVAFTGAGISTESGLPDFRGPQGMWTKDPGAAAMFNISSFKAKERVRDKYWASRLGMMGTVTPNEGHKVLADLYAAGKLKAIVTQNIDGLHQAAGVPDEIVHELHGSLSHAECWACGFRLPMDEFLTLANEPPWKPSTYRCHECRKLFKPGVVLFGDSLDEEVFNAAHDAVRDADLLLVLGSSLTVYPANTIVDFGQDLGVTNVIINNDPTEYDEDADMVLRGGIGATLRAAVPHV